MARRYRRRKRGGRRRGVKIAATVGVLAGLYGMYKWSSQASNTQEKVGRVVESMIGINPFAPNKAFRWEYMYFTLPAVGGMALSLVASKVGLNKYTPKGINI